ncbi:hypothetical protein BDV30DRAFT_145071 [Aspergillus minisclerotigenes]|uniref:Uncharacterized protein n=1 Tax=Aspergillus minisclerotigenes TaxID=656917 RepID=A0A5N6IY04_9EURO|nr:hypothetical protein BDV30DRAFT_145071 [Aspergillus minisclerotigenes]
MPDLDVPLNGMECIRECFYLPSSRQPPSCDQNLCPGQRKASPIVSSHIRGSTCSVPSHNCHSTFHSVVFRRRVYASWLYRMYCKRSFGSSADYQPVYLFFSFLFFSFFPFFLVPSELRTRRRRRSSFGLFENNLEEYTNLLTFAYLPICSLAILLCIQLDAATLNGGSGPESYLTRQRYSRLWIRILVLDGTGAPSIYG